jgi:hypothetical protein
MSDADYRPSQEVFDSVLNKMPLLEREIPSNISINSKSYDCWKDCTTERKKEWESIQNFNSIEEFHTKFIDAYEELMKLTSSQGYLMTSDQAYMNLFTQFHGATLPSFPSTFQHVEVFGRAIYVYLL